MTYRGIVSNGVVVLDGIKPEEGTIVLVTPVESSVAGGSSMADHPAAGIWKDRTDLPDDAVEASRVLRRKLMSRVDE